MPHHVVETSRPTRRAARAAPVRSWRLNSWRPEVSRPIHRPFSTAMAPTGFPAGSVIRNIGSRRDTAELLVSLGVAGVAGRRDRRRQPARVAARPGAAARGCPAWICPWVPRVGVRHGGPRRVRDCRYCLVRGGPRGGLVDRGACRSPRGHGVRGVLPGGGLAARGGGQALARAVTAASVMWPIASTGLATLMVV